MNILIVGAGAVGLVYGQHLSMAGHRVTFFVKEQHRNDLKSGVSMIRKRRLVKDEVRHFSDFSLLSQWNHVAGEEWDYVFLAISSDALRALPFGIVKDAIADATLLMLQPSETDYKVLGEYWSEENVVKGMINMISYYLLSPVKHPCKRARRYVWPIICRLRQCRCLAAHGRWAWRRCCVNLLSPARESTMRYRRRGYPMRF